MLQVPERWGFRLISMACYRPWEVHASQGLKVDHGKKGSRWPLYVTINGVRDGLGLLPITYVMPGVLGCTCHAYRFTFTYLFLLSISYYIGLLRTTTYMK